MPALAKQNLLLLQAITREVQNQAAKEGALVIGLPRGPRSCLPLEASSQGVCWRPEATLSCYFSYLNTVMFFSSLRRFPPFDKRMPLKNMGEMGDKRITAQILFSYFAHLGFRTVVTYFVHLEPDFSNILL